MRRAVPLLALLAAGPAWAIGGAARDDFSIQATGGVRLLGGFLHFPDEPAIFPNGDDGLAAAEARLILDGGLGPGLKYEVHLYSDLQRMPSIGLGGTFGGTFAVAGSFASPYRTPYLQWTFWSSGTMNGQMGVDRLSVTLHEGRYTLTAGRFPVNYAVTQIFTPNDFFAPFTVTAINRVYKPGVDAVRLGVNLGALSSLELLGVIGATPGGEPAWPKSALLARASVVGWHFEWAALAGKLAGRWVVGGSFQGNIGPIGLRGEGHAGFPDHLAGQADAGVHGRVAGGLGKEFSWHNVAVAAEYQYLSDGAGDPSGYVARAGRFLPDDQPYLGQHYVGARVGGDIIPVLKASAMVLLNAADRSGLVLASLAYDISDEATFVGGVLLPWGDRPPAAGAVMPMGPAVPGSTPAPSLLSEFGLTPIAAFLEMRFYF